MTPGDAEVPGRDGFAVQLHERQHEPAHARVDVHRRADRGRELGELGDRVDDALRVLRRGADDEHGVVVDARGHRVDVGAEVGAHRHLVHPDAEVVRGLVERGVRALGDDHLGCGDARVRRAPVRVRP